MRASAMRIQVAQPPWLVALSALASGDPQISQRIWEVPMHQMTTASASIAVAACLLLAAGGSAPNSFADAGL
jgi:hypothetical protein